VLPNEFGFLRIYSDEFFSPVRKIKKSANKGTYADYQDLVEGLQRDRKKSALEKAHRKKYGECRLELDRYIKRQSPQLSGANLDDCDRCFQMMEIIDNKPYPGFVNDLKNLTHSVCYCGQNADPLWKCELPRAF